MSLSIRCSGLSTHEPSGNRRCNTLNRPTVRLVAMGTSEEAPCNPPLTDGLRAEACPRLGALLLAKEPPPSDGALMTTRDVDNRVENRENERKNNQGRYSANRVQSEKAGRAARGRPSEISHIGEGGRDIPLLEQRTVFAPTVMKIRKVTMSENTKSMWDRLPGAQSICDPFQGQSAWLMNAIYTENVTGSRSVSKGLFGR